MPRQHYAFTVPVPTLATMFLRIFQKPCSSSSAPQVRVTMREGRVDGHQHAGQWQVNVLLLLAVSSLAAPGTKTRVLSTPVPFRGGHAPPEVGTPKPFFTDHVGVRGAFVSKSLQHFAVGSAANLAMCPLHSAPPNWHGPCWTFSNPAASFKCVGHRTHKKSQIQ